jgi:hypothetical protein
VLLVICYPLLKYDDGSIRLLAGKSESRNAWMPIKC